MEIYAIMDGTVLEYILDPNFEKYLPIIPSEVRNKVLIIKTLKTSLNFISLIIIKCSIKN